METTSTNLRAHVEVMGRIVELPLVVGTEQEVAIDGQQLRSETGAIPGRTARPKPCSRGTIRSRRHALPVRLALDHPQRDGRKIIATQRRQTT